MQAKHTYANSAAIRRVLQALQKAGVQVGSVRISSDGAIEITPFQPQAAIAANDFDRLSAEGRL